MPYSAGVFFLVMKLKPPKIIRHLFPSLIWEIDDPEGVFLTFDDGPTPGITEWILAMLEKYDAKATFFRSGQKRGGLSRSFPPHRGRGPQGR